MNKYQKQIASRLLNHEVKLVKTLKNVYSESLKSVNSTIKNLQQSIAQLKIEGADQSLINSKIYQLEYQQMLKDDVGTAMNLLAEQNVKSVHDFLKAVYYDSFYGDVFVLQKAHKIPVFLKASARQVVKALTAPTEGKNFFKRLYNNVEGLKETTIFEVSRGIATGKGYKDIAINIKNQTEISFRKAYRIARTEGGRVATEAQIDNINACKEKGIYLQKRWDATLDNRTRPVHGELDGQIVEADEYFQCSLGQVFAPHRFSITKQNVNCRCRLASLPWWDIDPTSTTRMDNVSKEIIPYKTYSQWRKEYDRQLFY